MRAVLEVHRGEPPGWLARWLRPYEVTTEEGKRYVVQAVKVVRVMQPIDLHVRLGDPIRLNPGWSGYIVYNPSGYPFPSDTENFESKTRELPATLNQEAAAELAGGGFEEEE